MPASILFTISLGFLDGSLQVTKILVTQNRLRVINTVFVILSLVSEGGRSLSSGRAIGLKRENILSNPSLGTGSKVWIGANCCVVDERKRSCKSNKKSSMSVGSRASGATASTAMPD